jgi:hypothetical protein
MRQALDQIRSRRAEPTSLRTIQRIAKQHAIGCIIGGTRLVTQADIREIQSQIPGVAARAKHNPGNTYAKKQSSHFQA